MNGVEKRLDGGGVNGLQNVTYSHCSPWPAASSSNGEESVKSRHDTLWSTPPYRDTVEFMLDRQCAFRVQLPAYKRFAVNEKCVRVPQLPFSRQKITGALLVSTK
jgi:hypothetical protein